MPWKAVGNDIVRADTGKVVGHSTSHAKALASVRARYANTDGYAHGGIVGNNEDDHKRAKIQALHDLMHNDTGTTRSSTH